MLEIVHGMTKHERDTLMKTRNWREKLNELVVLASDYYVFDGLGEVVSAVGGVTSEEEDGT